jgi:glycosyltransferase involved in cell wall biosynthesis
VLWVHQNFVSRRHAGSERPIHTVAALLERGWAVDLVSGTQGYQGTVIGDASDVQTDGLLSWHRIDCGPLSNFVARRRAAYASFLRRAAALTRRLPRPDLVFASTPPLPHVALSIEEAFRHDAPLVLEVRDLWPAFLEALGVIRSRAALRVLAGLEALAYRSASAVVSTSPAFRPYLEGLGVERDAILDVPHGAPDRDIDRARADGANWREARNLDNRTMLLYAGSLNESHGVGRILEAAAATTQERIVWVIAGGGRGREAVEDAARRLPNLVYMGAMPRRELDPLLGACDASIVTLENHPIFASVLPGKLVDALASAVPVICSIPGQASALVEYTGAGWTCAPTTTALIETGRSVAALPTAERRAMGEAGRAFVRARLSAETQGRAIATLCGEIVDRSKKIRPRLIAAAVGAARDAAVWRTHRLVETLFVDPRGASARLSFERWAANAPSVPEGPTLEIPSVLA